jgi:hypothetical protein
MRRDCVHVDNLSDKDHLKHIGLDRMIIFKCILKQLCGMV